MSVQAYPLHWPPGVPRTRLRDKGRFDTTIAKALDNVRGSLKLFASDSGKVLEHVVISSNVGGLSYKERDADDPGVAVWFTWDGLPLCIAVDRYRKPESNLQAIHHIIEARRVELRHGTLALVRASFAGFKALPAPPGTSWREVLGFAQGQAVNAQQVAEAWKREAAKHHPDRGGAPDKMQAVNMARDTAIKEIGP